MHHNSSNNYFLAEDWKEHYDITLPEEVIHSLDAKKYEETLNSPCPFHKERLIKDTHFLFLGLDMLPDKTPLSVMEWHTIHTGNKQPRFFWQEPNIWYKDEPFATDETCSLRLYLMLKEYVPETDENLVYNDQLKILPPEYEVPSAIEIVTANMLSMKKTGQALHESKWVWSNNTESVRGEGVAIGHYYRKPELGSPGLRIHDFWHNDERSSVGLAALRRM